MAMENILWESISSTKQFHSDYFRYLYPSANCREKRKSKGDTLLEEIYQDDNNVLIHFPRP